MNALLFYKLFELFNYYINYLCTHLYSPSSLSAWKEKLYWQKTVYSTSVTFPSSPWSWSLGWELTIGFSIKLCTCLHVGGGGECLLAYIIAKDMNKEFLTQEVDFCGFFNEFCRTAQHKFGIARYCYVMLRCWNARMWGTQTGLNNGSLGIKAAVARSFLCLCVCCVMWPIAK